MAQPANHRFRFKLPDIVLREELELTENQRFLASNFLKSEWSHTYIDVFPKTIFVPKDVAETQLEINRSVIISGVDLHEYGFVYGLELHVYGAPEFPSRKFVKKSKYEVEDSYLKQYVNIAKNDLKMISVFDTALPVSAEFEQQKCFVCKAPHNEHKERRLFALPCGHTACRACWRDHCESYLARGSKFHLMRGMSPLPSCVNVECTEKLTISRAAVLLGDEALNIWIAYEWRKKLCPYDTLRCAGCRHWMKRTYFYSKARHAICLCGCYSCVEKVFNRIVSCGQLDHTPLRCKDAAEWSRIRTIENEDEAAAEAEKVFGLSRENFDDCLSPSKAIASEQFKKNLRFMKTYDRKHGKMLERSMPMVARMLEMRLVQQFSNRSEMQPRADNVSRKKRSSDGFDRYVERVLRKKMQLRAETVSEEEQAWFDFEERFMLALDTLGETRDKAVCLEASRRSVFSYYEIYDL